MIRNGNYGGKKYLPQNSGITLKYLTSNMSPPKKCISFDIFRRNEYPNNYCSYLGNS